jgi:putative ABC transport system permease protein
MKWRKRMLEELDADIAEHIERETQDNIALGMTPEEARYAAVRKFGNVTRVKEEVRDVWAVRWWDQLLADVRFGLRMMRKSPGFTAVVALTLALGIGANTYIFSMVDALLLRPMQFPEAGRIVALWERLPNQGVERNELSPANFLDWQAENHVFDHIAVQSWWDANLGGIAHPEHLHGFLVTPDFFAALEAQPLMGRAFLPEEATPGRDHEAVLSYALWRNRFGADPAAVGRTVLLDGVQFTVVGVMGAGFNYPSGAEIWAPLAFTPQDRTNRGSHYLHGVAHLAAGVTLRQAQAEMRGIAARLAASFPATNTGRDAQVMALVESEVGQTRTPLAVMLAAVALVLLIACVNIANLLLARAGSRRRETAIRAAMGAPYGRLIRQWLVESMLLGLLGGVLGVGLAFLCLRGQVIRIPPEFARMITGWDRIAINTPVLAFTLLISLGTGLIFGLLPALTVSRLNLNETLKEGAPSTGRGRSRGIVRNVLIVAEVGVSLVLLATAGLMMKSFLRLEEANPGFNARGVLTMSMVLPQAKYTSDKQITNFYVELLSRVQSLPGVQDAAATNMLPLGGANTTSSIRIEGIAEPKPGEEPDANFRCVSDSYFRAMQIPILRGREFTAQDGPKGQRAVAVNETFAERYWPGEDAIGKRIRFSGPAEEQPWYTVVALVGDVRNQLDQRARPEMYFPMRQQARNTMALVVRTAGEPRALTESVRAQVLALDRDLPIFQVMTMEDWRSVSTIAQRVGGTLMAAFAGFALVLAATGLFGVIAYMVTERKHEIGVRMALGASRGEIGRLVVGRGMALVLIGMLLGLPLALGMGHAVAGLLYGVAPTDSATFVGVAVLLGCVSLAACYLPARRATRVDPLVALRYE